MSTERDWTSLGRRARWAREMAGLSTGQIARLVMVPRAAVELYEADDLGQPVLRAHLTAHLPGYYGVSFRWLTTGKPDPSCEPAIDEMVGLLTRANVPEEKWGPILDLLRATGGSR